MMDGYEALEGHGDFSRLSLKQVNHITFPSPWQPAWAALPGSALVLLRGPQLLWMLPSAAHQLQAHSRAALNSWTKDHLRWRKGLGASLAESH